MLIPWTIILSPITLCICTSISLTAAATSNGNSTRISRPTRRISSRGAGEGERVIVDHDCDGQQEWVLGAIDGAERLAEAALNAARLIKQEQLDPGNPYLWFFRGLKDYDAVATIFERVLQDIRPATGDRTHSTHAMLNIRCTEPPGGVVPPCSGPDTHDALPRLSSWVPTTHLRSYFGPARYEFTLCPAVAGLPPNPPPCSTPIPGQSPGTLSPAWALLDELIAFSHIAAPGYYQTSKRMDSSAAFTARQCALYMNRDLDPRISRRNLSRFASFAYDLGYLTDNIYSGGPCPEQFHLGNFDDEAAKRYFADGGYQHFDQW
ncbi:MAG: hypothetical protein M1825_004325 [Sarcosagium campestre]|nr:MAG: hypothetical protein M1825_004325 [Sarcosagium campestre]